MSEDNNDNDNEDSNEEEQIKPLHNHYEIIPSIIPIRNAPNSEFITLNKNSFLSNQEEVQNQHQDQDNDIEEVQNQHQDQDNDQEEENDNNKQLHNYVVPQLQVQQQQQEDEQIMNCTINILYAYSHIKEQKVIQLNINNILMCDIITKLSELGSLTEFKDFAISYYDPIYNAYKYYGKFPFKNNNHYQLQRSTEFTIKIRPILHMGNALRMEYCEEEQENIEEDKVTNYIKETSKRAKERKISYIIKKVYEWRRMYNGFDENLKDGTKRFTKKTLEEAAKIIKISKKSLDDYLIQLRMGKTYGFDFNQHKNDKVGVLRAFVKQHKAQNDDKGLNE